MTKINKLVKKVTNLWKKAQTCEKKWQRDKNLQKNVTKSDKLLKKYTELLIWTVKLVKLLQKPSTRIKMLGMVYDSTTTIALKLINLQHSLIMSFMKLVIEIGDVDGLEHLWAERNSGICLDTRTSGLGEVHVKW